MKVPLSLALGLLFTGSAGAQDEGALRISVSNALDTARSGEIIELKGALLGRFKGDDLQKLRVVDSKTSAELLGQAVDSDGDLVFDQLVFQADFGPRETRTFAIRLGERRAPTLEDFRVYGRFVRERFDDFAWENDKVAFRLYGEALETWQKEPLTSSAVDVWEKKTRRLAQGEWYMVDDYHKDHGEGGDFYPAGASRGCGGTGLWKDGQLYVSKNFRASRVFANGPLRLIFEVDYPVWEVPGVKEAKRVTLDAGQNLARFESRYTLDAAGGPVAWAVGIRKAEGASVRIERERGFARSWEHLTRYGENGWLGCAVVMDPAQIVDLAEDKTNHLVVARTPPGMPAAHYAGSGWDRSGDFKDVAAWDAYVEDFARRLRSPLKIEVAR